MCNEKKDFSLLRPFNEEAAKRGESIYTCYEQKLSYQAGPDVRGTIAVLNEHGYMITCRVQDIRMAPLCWVRTSVEDDTLKPVYKGDVLYHINERTLVSYKVRGLNSENDILFENYDFGSDKSYFTFTPPKVKRKIKMLGYRNVHNGNILFRDVILDPSISWERFPQLDTTVEIEE